MASTGLPLILRVLLIHLASASSGESPFPGCAHDNNDKHLLQNKHFALQMFL